MTAAQSVVRTRETGLLCGRVGGSSGAVVRILVSYITIVLLV